MLYLGVDAGTSGCRLTVIDENQQVCGESGAEWPAGQHDAPAIWWDTFVKLFKELSLHINPVQIQSVAVDGTSSSLLLTDEYGEPVSPVLMYNDARALTQSQKIQSVAPPYSGAHGATSSLAKLLYLFERHPQAVRALHQSDWLTGRLLGQYCFSDENNALKLGYDPQQRIWPEWLQRLSFPLRLLPVVNPPGTVLGQVGAAAAKQLGWPRQLRICAGTTDSTAAFLASGACHPGDGMTALGSTLVLKILSDKPVFAPEYGVYSHRLGDRWLVGGASNSGGAVLLKYFSREQLKSMTLKLSHTPLGKTDYYPLLQAGERFPHADPNRSPRLQPRPRDDVAFFQGILEGISHIEAAGYALLQKLGAPPLQRVYTSGGGSCNPAWQSLRENILKVPLPPPRRYDAAYGCALLAKNGLVTR